MQSSAEKSKNYKDGEVNMICGYLVLLILWIVLNLPKVWVALIFWELLGDFLFFDLAS